jgi:hypothetical protein
MILALRRDQRSGARALWLAACSCFLWWPATALATCEGIDSLEVGVNTAAAMVRNRNRGLAIQCYEQFVDGPRFDGAPKRIQERFLYEHMDTHYKEGIRAAASDPEKKFHLGKVIERGGVYHEWCRASNWEACERAPVVTYAIGDALIRLARMAEVAVEYRRIALNSDPERYFGRNTVELWDKSLRGTRTLAELRAEASGDPAARAGWTTLRAVVASLKGSARCECEPFIDATLREIGDVLGA